MRPELRPSRDDSDHTPRPAETSQRLALSPAVFGRKFSRLEESIEDDGYVAFIVQHDSRTAEVTVESYTPIHVDDSSPNSLDDHFADIYLSACDSDTISCNLLSTGATPPTVEEFVSTYVTRKYKPVAKKVKSVVTQSPEKFRVVREIKGDPLENMPVLSPIPPPFTPKGRYTEERKAIIDTAHPEGFLWPAERDLMHHFMAEQNEGFAWSDAERG